MSSGMKWTVGIVVALAIAAGAYYCTVTKGSWMADDSAVAPTTTLPSGSDTSDDSLDQDSAALDAQLSAFSSDNASMDQGIGDESVEQSSL